MKALGVLPALSAVIVMAPIPTPIGSDHRFHPSPTGPAVRVAKPVAAMSCSKRETRRFGVHVELFAERLVVLMPAGIGIAPPHVVRGPYVLGGRCSYPARTREPTGVVEVEAGKRLRLGQLFELWGQPLSRVRLAGFRAAPSTGVVAFISGRRWRGDPRAIRLVRHAQIVLEINGHIPPHPRYRFRKGL